MNQGFSFKERFLRLVLIHTISSFLTVIYQILEIQSSYAYKPQSSDYQISAISNVSPSFFMYFSLTIFLDKLVHYLKLIQFFQRPICVETL